MSLLNGKHTIKEIDGVRCTVVEQGASADRVNFLTNLLNLNGLEVKTVEESKKEEGVTDLVFHSIIWIYQRKLKTPEGKKVTPDYWNQKTKNLEPNYWHKKLKD
jgi:hypothetical protein